MFRNILQIVILQILLRIITNKKILGNLSQAMSVQRFFMNVIYNLHVIF